MIKAFGGVLAITLAGASLTACAGMTGGSPRPDASVSLMSNAPTGSQVLEESRCSMQEHQGLVGKALNTVPPNIAQAARVTPAGTRLDQQPMVPTRLTILYNPSDNMITELRCG